MADEDLIAEVRRLSGYQKTLLRSILQGWRELPPEIWAGPLFPGETGGEVVDLDKLTL